MVRNGKIANPHVLHWRLDIGDGRGIGGDGGCWWLVACSLEGFYTFQNCFICRKSSQEEEE